MANYKCEPNVKGGLREWWELRVNIANTDKRMIDWIVERWPGCLRVQIKGKGQKPVWSWTVNNRKVIPVLVVTLPYLVIKRERAEWALGYAAAQKNPGRRGYSLKERETLRGFANKIRQANGRGNSA